MLNELAALQGCSVKTQSHHSGAGASGLRLAERDKGASQSNSQRQKDKRTKLNLDGDTFDWEKNQCNDTPSLIKPQSVKVSVWITTTE